MMTFTRYSIKIANPGFLEIVIITLGEIYHMSRNQFSAMNTISLSLSFSHITYQTKKATAPLAFSSTRQDKNPCKRSRENTFLDRDRCQSIRTQIDLAFRGCTHIQIIVFRGVQIKQRSRSIYDQQSTVSIYIYILEIIPAITYLEIPIVSISEMHPIYPC